MPIPTHSQSLTPRLVVVLVLVLLSGMLFGYDQGVISGALVSIKASFSLTPLLLEVVTSWVTLGALFGALAGGELADSLGRKHAILVAGAVFTVGSLVEASAPGTLVLVAGRLIVGVGVGVAAVAAPLYAAELAPPALRGRFISGYQLAVAGGIFIAYLVDGWLSKDGAWRWMLGLSAAPGVVLIAVALLAPESPRWLLRMGRKHDAAAQMRKLHPGTDPDPAIASIVATLAADTPRRPGPRCSTRSGGAPCWSASDWQCSSRSPASTRSSTTPIRSSRPPASPRRRRRRP